MLIMTQAVHDKLYQTIKAELAQITKVYLKNTPISDLSEFIAHVQREIPKIEGVPKGFNMSAEDILKHIKQFNQMQVIDGNNCTEQTIGSKKVMVPNTPDKIVIL